MGLAYDPNETLKIPSNKTQLVEKFKVEDLENVSKKDEDVEMTPVKVHVSQELEAEAKAPRRRMFKLPNNQVNFLTYLLDKYGEDYKVFTLF